MVCDCAGCWGDERVVSYRLMMRAEPQLARLIDTAIRYMPAGSLYADLGRYLDQGSLYVNQLHFSDTEQAWLSGRGRTVRLVVNPDLMPYSGVNELGGGERVECRRAALGYPGNGSEIPAGACL